MQRSLKWVLIAGVLSGGVGGVAQAPTRTASKGTYVVKLTGQRMDAQGEASGQKRSALLSEIYWDNLYNVGKVAVVSAAKDGSSSFGVMILEGVSEAEATSLANGDPSVKAGVATADVLPLRVLQAKNLTRPRFSR